MSSSDEPFEFEEQDSYESMDSFIDDNNYDDSIQVLDENDLDFVENTDLDVIEDMVHNINDEMRTTAEDEVVTEVMTNDMKTENESLFENRDKSNIIYTQNGENCDNYCIICTEMWTTTADHQLVSLSCGHLFGRSCIEKWLQPSRRTQRCPQCNKTAKKKDIRTIYARNLKVLDTSERDEALAQLEKERLKNKKLEFELIEHSNKLKNILKENERLKKECMECQQKVKQLSSCSRNTENIISNKALKAMTNKLDAFKLFKEIEINSSGECRLLGYSNLFEVMAVSQPNPNTNLFPGFGIKKIFLNDFKTDNICIHSKTIKDFEINAYDGTILTTSLDKTVKLTSLLSKQSIMSYNLEVEAWSVAFNNKNKHEFYAGLRNGQILLFDTRMLYRPVDLLNSLEKTPVVSLNYINYEHSFLNTSGILSTQFNSFCFYERLNTSDSISSNSFSIINIPFEGRFTSAHFEPKSGLALVSCRPSVKHKNVTHFVMDLSVKLNDDNEHVINPNVIESFEGGAQQIQLSRTRIFAHPFNENSSLICAGDESTKGALIWDLSSSACIQKLNTELPILDMSLVQSSSNNEYYMTALTEKSLKIYKCFS